MANTFYAEIVAVSGRIFHGEVISLKAPGVDGGFEVLANHAAMLAAMKTGIMSLKTADGQRIEYATSGGFVQVSNNQVMILAESAESLNEINVERAKAAEARALEALSTADKEAREEAKKDLDRARNRLRAAMSKF
jgi:F-type H+-transporting ATPase subunit epsilon